MSKTKTVSVRECFAEVPDPRREHCRRHNLLDILALTIFAVVGGADSWVDVAEYGLRKLEWLQSLLELPNGIPSHDTLGRVFALLDPAALQRGFQRWIVSLAEATAGRLVAIDGKTLRHSFDTANGKGALHLVSAWATENRLMLGQQAVDGKSNEITAIPELVKSLALKGAIVTIDAMGCQKEITAALVDAGADYVLALKENQPTLYEDVNQLFLAGLENDFVDLKHHYWRTDDANHGRVETRHYHVVTVPQELRDQHPQWQDLRTLGMVFSERQVGAEPATVATRYYLSSLPAKVKSFARAVRGHWGIETSLHWVLDISFREDESRLRKDHGPENLALIRRLAASLMHQETTAKGGVACKRKQAGWDNDYLLEVLGVRI
jgi:predicted transposase YbfD/YdcC